MIFYASAGMEALQVQNKKEATREALRYRFYLDGRVNGNSTTGSPSNGYLRSALALVLSSCLKLAQWASALVCLLSDTGLMGPF